VPLLYAAVMNDAHNAAGRQAFFKSLLNFIYLPDTSFILHAFFFDSRETRVYSLRKSAQHQYIVK